MCYLLSKCERKTFTGYKVVTVDKHGNYYSPATGIRYNVGKIPIIKDKPRQRKYTGNNWYNPHLPSSHNYTSNYVGYTAVFETYEDAKKCLNRWDTAGLYLTSLTHIIIKMTLSTDLYFGKYASGTPIIAGKYIVSMKKI
jgi:hypothetical protein